MYPGRDIEKDVRDETSGHFKRLLTSCLQANRQEELPVDREKARKEAEELHAAGEKKWGTDESKFNHILAMRSYDQLLATFEEYRKVSSYDIVKTIEHEMSGDLKGAFYVRERDEDGRICGAGESGRSGGKVGHFFVLIAMFRLPSNLLRNDRRW